MIFNVKLHEITLFFAQTVVLVSKSGLGILLPGVYSTNRSNAVIPVLVLLFVALWFILQGDLF